jgi:glucose/mannose-6-phosphate isomerase
MHRMMSGAIENFPHQFDYDPVIQQEKKFLRLKKFIIIGMGGSHLAADILSTWNPSLPLIIHQDYGLPFLSLDELRAYTIILSSYSGNTEEVLSVHKEVCEKKLPSIAVTTGGALLESAKKHRTPYIQLPDLGIQPRLALGLSFRALLKIIGYEYALAETQKLTRTLHATEYKETGSMLAKRLKGYIPIIYASRKNFSLAYNWKIKCNETGKIPAFCNVFPELNHNEMAGFDAIPSTRALAQSFYCIVLKDASDDPRVQKRMDILEKLYQDRNLHVEIIHLAHGDIFQKIFSSLILADWTTYCIAQEYGNEAESVPMVEKFKELMAQ